MKHKYYLIVLILFHLLFPRLIFSQVVFDLSSPDEKILSHIKIEDNIEIKILYESSTILEYSEISINIYKKQIGYNPKILKKVTDTFHEVIYPEVPEKNSRIHDHYKEMLLYLKGNVVLHFRAYNNGVAWRFETNLKDEVTVNGEGLILNFPKNSKIWFPEEEQFFSHNERLYIYDTIEHFSKDQFCSLPALIESKDGVKVLFTETGLEDYPGLWLQATEKSSLKAIFPGVALEEKQSNDRNVKVTRHADYIAKTSGKRTFPWRILAIANQDADLITNQLSYLLAEPCAIEDPSWIKPGKVAWDWWNDWNIYGVDFEAGVNTETYKYYIDFASQHGIEYIIMDEGWYVLGDLMNIVPEIDMEEILDYAESKNVGVILWVIWKTLEDQWVAAFDQFEKWGVKGIKVDFMQRDDQWMVNYYHRVAEESANRRLLVNFHGAYKPAGLRRKFPNVITREGVVGLENVKWSKKNTPEHNVTIPFIRMVAGPMDYTPGAMINANEKNFAIRWSEPMSMGTRCHQLAMYVVYESPLQMLCDNPSNYYNEPECMEFLSAVPTVWDTTIVLSAAIGEHITLARKRGEDWYIGAMTNWESRDIKIDFSFLGDGNFLIDYYQDGKNANSHAADFKRNSDSIVAEDTMTIHLAPGGGWVARIAKK